jgi:hypothetical protein
MYSYVKDNYTKLGLPKEVRMWNHRIDMFTIFLGFVILAVAAPPAFADPDEPLVIKDTDYPIPQGAVFVATDGNDFNSGNESRPFRTISAAINAATEGDTISPRETG